MPVRIGRWGGKTAILIGGKHCRACDGRGCEFCDWQGIDPDGPTAVDILPALERFTLEVDEGGAYATFTARVTPRIDYPAEVRQIVGGGAELLDGITAEEIEVAAVSGGIGTSMGASILRHLRERLT